MSLFRSRVFLATSAAGAMATMMPLALGASAQVSANPDRNARAFSYAVYGDAPYGKSPTDTSETDATPGFIAKAISSISLGSMPRATKP